MSLNVVGSCPIRVRFFPVGRLSLHMAQRRLVGLPVHETMLGSGIWVLLHHLILRSHYFPLAVLTPKSQNFESLVSVVVRWGACHSRLLYCMNPSFSSWMNQLSVWIRFLEKGTPIIYKNRDHLEADVGGIVALDFASGALFPKKSFTF